MTKFSYQLYSSRNFPPIEDTLKMLADLGYAEVEGYGGLFSSGIDPVQFRSMLDANGLAMPTAHFGIDDIKADPHKMAAMARTLGVKTVFAPHVVAEKRPSDADGWRQFGAMLDDLGAPLRDSGLTFGWHNHDFELVPLESGERPLDLILAGGPKLAVELDVAWVVKGGADPAEYIAKYADRLVSAHVKDIAAEGECLDEDGWADVGHGVMDWSGLMARLRDTGCQHFVMEHDNPNDHARFARRSIETVQSL